MALIEIDIEKKVNSYSHESRKRFGSFAPDGWSNSDSNSDFENDPSAANKTRLSLRHNSKRFKLAKPKEIEELKQPNPTLNMKRNMNCAVKNLQTILSYAVFVVATYSAGLPPVHVNVQEEEEEDGTTVL